jgi:hypothetical protein
MFTISHCWINDRPIILEANCTVTGLFKTIEEAREGFENWLETTLNEGCTITRLTQDQVSFLTPDGNKRGFVEIKCIDNQF